MAGNRCLLVSKDEAGQVRAEVAETPASELADGEVLIRVAFSSLNYKDALAARGHPGVVRKFPHVPGIDAAGVVEASGSPAFAAGAEVLVTGYGLGANIWGGFAAHVRVPAAWVVPLPRGLDLRQSMIYGTAGFTAALSVHALQTSGVQPSAGEIVVTGATGGVGCLAVALLAKTGYRVAAVTGKPQAAEFLAGLGAARVLGRDEVNDASERPLLAARWAGAVDTVGGRTLATIVRQTDRGGCVAACGLVGGAELPLTVYPFLLRGVLLAGIDSAECPMALRRELWDRLAGPWKPAALDRLAREVALESLGPEIDAILAGQITGRVLVRPSP